MKQTGITLLAIRALYAFAAAPVARDQIIQ
jgi:hypothetical protein